MSRKNIINRVLNRPSESRGSQPSGLLLVLFVEAKRINPFPFGNFPLHGKHAPVGAARCACFLVLFAKSKKNVKPFPFRELPDKQKACPCRGSTLRVLLLPFSLKHGRLAHIRSQFSLFRRSPTHKNLPLAIFCTSEQGVPRFCKPRFSAPQRRYR